jgi:hypothetical protein
MNILPRNVPAAETNSKKGSARATASRRIEVTVERETINMLVRGEFKENEKGASTGAAGPDSRRLKLPPPAAARDKRHIPGEPIKARQPGG